jgi:hypothetical protein
MRDKLNADGHDESQYLPRKWFNPRTGKEEPYPVVNPFRQAKGDISRNDDDKLEAMTWLPDILLKRGKISGDHHSTCLSAFRAALSTRNALGVENLRAYLSEVMGEEIPSGEESDIFFNLATKLSKLHFHTCMWVVFEEMNRGNVALACSIIGTIQESIERAQDIIDSCKKKPIDSIRDRDNVPIVTAPELYPNSARTLPA